MSLQAEAEAHVLDIVRRARSSFYWSMRLLPGEKRRAMYAIYAYCRELDDIADGSLPRAEKLARLEGWRREITALYAGSPTHPIAIALAGPVARYRLDRRWFEEILTGVSMDATGDILAPSLLELQLYCRRVAGAVGMLSIAVYGASGKAAAGFALALGDAVQLTNILRDLREDAADGRLYLPADMLEAAGIHMRDPDAVLDHPSITRVCAAMIDWAEQRYADAEDALRDCDRQALRPAIVILATYKRLLDRLKQDELPASHRIRLGQLEKIAIALRAGLTLKP
ncbi:presqualene diphosphate synthase HpnD [Oceanibaculum sp.]|uniref:presqualene diphosphate synthase HpnD n=1 Tax=Oceanibaculum sp. TaxID=1903597 RepID=UPI0025858290|nr:presqualene diphosphate synthase HpnD [Oceanibaculum sp.]MCH2396073.1 presqualene diphosphate synthase HpnD [Oceanibaculum sp.]